MALKRRLCLSGYLRMRLDAGMEAVRSENVPVVCGNLEVEKESELILGPAGENLLCAGFGILAVFVKKQRFIRHLLQGRWAALRAGDIEHFEQLVQIRKTKIYFRPDMGEAGDSL